MKISELIIRLVEILTHTPYEDFEELTKSEFDSVIESFLALHPGTHSYYEGLTTQGTRRFTLHHGVAIRSLELPLSQALTEGKFRTIIVSRLNEILDSLIEYIPAPRTHCPHCKEKILEEG